MGLCALCQAVEADRKDDRDIICEEVFTDLTGGLDDFLKGSFQMPPAQKRIIPGILAPLLAFCMLGLLSELCMCHAEQLQVPRTRNCRFYEILAPYFRKVHASALPKGTLVFRSILQVTLHVLQQAHAAHCFSVHRQDTYESRAWLCRCMAQPLPLTPCS